MTKMLKVTLVIILTSGLIITGCATGSAPSPTPQPPSEETQTTYQLVIDLLGEKGEFFVDSQGKLMSKVEVSSADDRVSLSLDKGTIVLDKNGELLQTIQAIIEPSPPPPPKDAYIVGTAYNLKPQGATFDPWLLLTLSYNPEELPQGMSERDLYVACRNGTEWYLPRYRKVDTQAHSVTIQVYHFTTCAILGPRELAPPSTPTPTQGTKVGNLAPSFQLQNLDGQTVSLNELQGKPVLVNFWATWCSPCRSEMPYMQQIYEEWSDKELVLLAINIGESSSKAEEFMQSYNLSFPVLLDTGRSVAQKYNIQYVPTTFLVDKDGIIQATKIGAYRDKAEIEKSLSKIIP